MSTEGRGSAVPPEGAGPRRRRGPLLSILMLLIATGMTFLIWHPASPFRSQSSGRPPAIGRGSIPTYSSAQGAQDAPRSETLAGRDRDYDTCMETLRLRRVVLDTAKDTCSKLVTGTHGN